MIRRRRFGKKKYIIKKSKAFGAVGMAFYKDWF